MKDQEYINHLEQALASVINRMTQAVVITPPTRNFIDTVLRSTADPLADLVRDCVVEWHRRNDPDIEARGAGEERKPTSPMTVDQLTRAVEVLLASNNTSSSAYKKLQKLVEEATII